MTHVASYRTHMRTIEAVIDTPIIARIATLLQTTIATNPPTESPEDLSSSSKGDKLGLRGSVGGSGVRKGVVIPIIGGSVELEFESPLPLPPVQCK